jgi:hypothetical protein
MAGVCLFGRDGVLPFGIGSSHAEWLRCAPPSYGVPASFLSLQLNLCLPQINYRQVNLLHLRRWTQTARYFLSTERIPLPSLLEQESSALLPSLLVSFVTQVVLQSLLPRLSLLFLQEIVRHGSNITQLQHLPEAANFQRHISPPHPPQLKAAFVQPPQASSAKLPRDQC